MKFSLTCSYENPAQQEMMLTTSPGWQDEIYAKKLGQNKSEIESVCVCLCVCVWERKKINVMARREAIL